MCPTKMLTETLWEIYRGDSALPPGESARGTTPSAKARLHAAEEGMVSLVTVVAVLFFLVLLGLIANVARVTNQKVEVQNSADAVAYSSALCMARSMNAVTGANHVMGELTAINVLIDAIGGPELFQGIQSPSGTSRNFNTQILLVWTAAQAAGDKVPDSFASQVYSKVSADNGVHTAGGMIYDARLTLKFWTWYAMVVRAIGNAVQDVPIIGPFVGTGLVALTELVFAKILQEWTTLDYLEKISRSSLPAIRQTLDTLVKLIDAFAVAVVELTPLSIQATTRSVSQANRITGAIYPAALEIRLPVKREDPPQTGGDTYQPSNTKPYPPLAQALIYPINQARSFLNSNDPFLKEARDTFKSVLGFDLDSFIPSPPPPQGYPENPSQPPFEALQIDRTTEGYSQWVRATYPWVAARRASIEGAMDDVLTFSLASGWYQNWSNKYTLARSHYYRTDPGGNLFMYIMQDSQPDQKGQEPWTRREGSRLAEQLFMVMGFAHRPPPAPFSPALYKQPNPDGFVAYAQAMLYNANEQSGSQSSGFQPQIGWDTLNWKSPVTQSGAYEFDQATSSSGGSWSDVLDFLHPGGQQPTIVLNWQAKLVPVTRLGQAKASSLLPAKIQKVLQRTPELSAMTNH